MQSADNHVKSIGFYKSVGENRIRTHNHPFRGCFLENREKFKVLIVSKMAGWSLKYFLTPGRS